jgi:hypothetical protein
LCFGIRSVEGSEREKLAVRNNKKDIILWRVNGKSRRTRAANAVALVIGAEDPTTQPVLPPRLAS